jgi:hypothetical protein
MKMSKKIEKYLYKSVLRNPNNAFSDNIAEKYINPEYVERLEQKYNTLIEGLQGLETTEILHPLADKPEKMVYYDSIKKLLQAIEY